jgi:predicted RNA binding protein YcfA (HicA-like mRNA interferase family)
MTPKGKVGTVVPLHKDLKIGTLRGVLKLANIDVDEFAKYL